jgi:hypothetical protein
VRLLHGEIVDVDLTAALLEPLQLVRRQSADDLRASFRRHGDEAVAIEQLPKIRRVGLVAVVGPGGRAVAYPDRCG